MNTHSDRYMGLCNSYLEISMNNFMHNIRFILSTLPEGCSLMPVLKCNAYGCGAQKLAEALEDNGRVSYICLAQLTEALSLRAEGIHKPLLVMGAVPSVEHMLAGAEKGITLALCSPDCIRPYAEALRGAGLRLSVHLCLNTGFNRFGIEPEELPACAAALKENADVLSVTGTYSHFGLLRGGDEAKSRYESFLRLCGELSRLGIAPGLRHICASAAFEQNPEYALDGVRIGRRLYTDAVGVTDTPLREVASYRGYVLDVSGRRKGSFIGYDSAVSLSRDSRIALIGTGSGDTLLSELIKKGTARVLIGGKVVPLLATCMDCCYADVTDTTCAVGDEATFFGYDKAGNLLSGQDVADEIGKEGCDLTAPLGVRVPRVYTD